MSPVPIIRIEVETMKQVMFHAFQQQLLNLDEQFKLAVENACKPEKIQSILNQAANKYIREAVEEETKHYFLHGNGRKHIAELVKTQLEKETF